MGIKLALKSNCGSSFGEPAIQTIKQNSQEFKLSIIKRTGTK